MHNSLPWSTGYIMQNTSYPLDFTCIPSPAKQNYLWRKWPNGPALFMQTPQSEGKQEHWAQPEGAITPHACIPIPTACYYLCGKAVWVMLPADMTSYQPITQTKLSYFLFPSQQTGREFQQQKVLTTPEGDRGDFRRDTDIVKEGHRGECLCSRAENMVTFCLKWTS